MKNSELIPFNRNRYYKGKMLTSADFEAEQLYMNNKRRFLNNVMYGSGIVCGFGVYSLDDLSLFIDDMRLLYNIVNEYKIYNQRFEAFPYHSGR